MLKRTPLKKKSYTLKKSPLRKISERGLIKKEEKKIQAEKRRQMFLEIWDEREIEEIRYDGIKTGKFYCEDFETGIRLYRIPFRENTCCYHHILEKSKYPEYDLCKWNIVIISPFNHDQVHTNIDKTPKVKAKTEELYQKHINGLL